MLHATWRVARVGLIAAGVVALAGWGLGRSRFGRSDADTVARVESELRQQVAATANSLERIATGLAAQRDLVVDARGTQAANARLFDAVDAALATEEPGRAGLSIYDPLGKPVAWGGRTSDLPKNRLDGPASLLIAQNALGPRLVRLEPVIDRSRGFPVRIGTVVAERQLGGRRTTPEDPESFVISTTVVPVAVRVRLGDVVPPDRFTFPIPAPGSGPVLDAQIVPADVQAARGRWADQVRGAALLIVGLTLIFVGGAILDLRRDQKSISGLVRTTAGALVAIGLTRLVIGMATAALLAGTALMRPVDVLATGLTGLAVVWLVLDTMERWRLSRPRSPVPLTTVPAISRIAVTYAAAGAATVGVLWAYETVLRGVVSQTNFDLLQFSLHPIDPARLAIMFALLLLHAAVLWTAVAVTRVPTLWRTRRAFSRRGATAIAWAAGAGVTALIARSQDGSLPIGPMLAALLVVGAGAVAIDRLRRWTRRASQAALGFALFVALVVPALVMYPSLVSFMKQAEEALISTRYGPDTIGQREELRNTLYAALDEIEAVPSLSELVTTDRESAPSPANAFRIWSHTDLSVKRLTSAVELFGANGRLISRFAFNLPEYAEGPPREAKCPDWNVVDELSPFGSAERHVLRATRAICDDGEMLGTIVVSVMLDYRTLPFIESQSPYLESLQPERQQTSEAVFGRDVEFAAYGWSRAPINYSGTRVWPVADDVFQRLVESREPFWTEAERDGVPFRVYFMGDRGGIYALGYPVNTWRRHIVNLAELVFLAGVLYVFLVAGATMVNAVMSRTPTSGRALLREIRASFYRKLFLAFVAAAVVPVVILAYAVHAYFATQFEAEVKEAAANTATVAQRLVEDYATLQQRPMIDDQIMVLIRRAIDQDVNLFERSELRATSALEVFASGLLPRRTPGDVYRRIVLDRLPTFVGEQQVGDFHYLLAAAPVRAEGREGIVTVPVTSRLEDADRQIDELDHQVLSAVVLFSLLGAALGYWMAERIADPINRLTRATHRIARGNLDARVVAATSDELGRLIRDFNGMAEDLKQQRSELERTQRLEAWADMARQVAHDIKNPLTPIQLSAEHAQRVNVDRGRPLSPVLDECTSVILSQVRLLRQIAAEFSSFASSAKAKPAPTNVVELLEEVINPYRLGLSERIAIEVRVVEPPPPLVNIDRTLLARAFTNVIENALHAMPGTGTIRAVVRREPGAETSAAPAVTEMTAPAQEVVAIEIGDTGVGMDQEALGRIFEPYFSTKATGTGLGLTIAKRNVELNGGTIEVTSEKGVGTSVTIRLPIPIVTLPVGQQAG